ncbi:MAG: hypothetical protein V1720_22035 [bacterium]
MKKIIPFIILLIVLSVTLPPVVRYVYYAFHPIVVPAPTPPSKTIRVPVDIFEGEKHGYAIATSLENKSLGTGYVFTEHPELSGAGPNDAWTVSEIRDIPPLQK